MQRGQSAFSPPRAGLLQALDTRSGCPSSLSGLCAGDLHRSCSFISFLLHPFLFLSILLYLFTLTECISCIHPQDVHRRFYALLHVPQPYHGHLRAFQ